MKRKYLEIILTVFCISVIALSIYLNPDIIRAKSYEEITQQEKPQYSGMITIWQISSWRVAQSSKTLCLLNAAQSFEKANPFVFIEVENVSVEEYQRYTAEGRYPDVLSFPAELEIELEKCASIPLDCELIPILQQVYYLSEQRAIPWQCTSSVVIANSKSADKNQAITSKYQSSDEIAQLINNLSPNDTTVLGSIFALVPLAVGDTTIQTTPVDISPYKGWNAYVSKETSIVYGSVWQNYSMNRLIEREKGFDCEYIIPSGDMPRYYWTQNFCVFSDDADKNAVISDYINMVLSERYQIKIADSTASFPVTDIALEYGGIRSDILSADYKSSMTIISGVGICCDDVVSALNGEANAKARLREKVIIQ